MLFSVHGYRKISLITERAPSGREPRCVDVAVSLLRRDRRAIDHPPWPSDQVAGGGGEGDMDPAEPRVVRLFR